MQITPSKEEVAQYRQYKAEGKYREAAKVLLPYKADERVSKLIVELRVLDGSTPERTKSGRRKTLIWVVILVVGMVLSGSVGYAIGSGRSGNAPGQSGEIGNILISAKMAGVCVEVFYDDYVYGDAFSAACTEEVEHIMVFYGAEIKYCYDRTERAELEAQFISCLVDNEVTFSGAFMLSVPRR